MPATARQLPAPRRSTAALPIPAVTIPVDPLQQLPQHARDQALRRSAMIRPAIMRVQQGVAVRAVAEWLATTADGMPSVSTLQRWIRAYLNEGVIGLATKYSGRQRKERGWEARALELYNRPTKPAYATVAFWLRGEGYDDANNKAVERYLKSMPSHACETSPARLGQHYYNQNVRPFVIRDNTVLPVGYVYQADGHCCDVYVAHPATGKPFRPEITVWIDVRSQYVVGWWMSEAESAHTTLFSLSRALIDHDHVPAAVHTDPGSGFKNRMISDEVTGYCARFSIEPMLALPGNAKGKGLTEGWFRWFEERCGKEFNTFCGHDRSDDFLRALTTKVRRGEIRLPTLEEYIHAVRRYFERYNINPQTALGCRPADLWAQLERTPLHTPAEAILRPRVERTVQRWGVKLDGRWYRAAELRAYEARKVVVEYSIHDDAHVWVNDQDGRLVCIAHLVEKTPWLPSSRIEEGQQRRLAGQQRRLQAHLDEAGARARQPLTAAAMVEALDADQAPAVEAPPSAPLALGHSIHIPAVHIPTPTAPRPVDAAELAEVQQTFAAAEAAEETPEHRYGRWLQLRADIAADQPVPPSQLAWADAYARSAECEGFVEIHESFGYVPGVADPNPHQEA
jgi:putative transposase